MPRSRAKWLSVPSGIMPSFVLLPIRAEAAAPIVPSPPPTTSISSPRSEASDTDRAFAAVDQLDLGVQARHGSLGHFLPDLRVGGDGSAAAIHEDGNARHPGR